MEDWIKDGKKGDHREVIIKAIRNAEKNTSGEIRVHLESRKISDPFARGRELFEKIGMTNTSAQNGVLIYLNTRTHQFAILGDAGIHAKVPADFWKDISQKMASAFSQDHFADGLKTAIGEAGEKLKIYFPCQRTDLNELPDEISYS